MTQNSSSHRIGIYIPQPCSLLTLGCISEPIARLNQILGEEKYQLVYVAEKAGDSITVSHSPVPLTVVAQDGLDKTIDCDALIVISEQLPDSPISPAVITALQRYHRREKSHILCLQAGWRWLLESQIGDNEPWSIHWRWEDGVNHCFPTLKVIEEGYHAGHTISSCAGQSSTLDFMLNYLAQYESNATLRMVADELCIDGTKQGSEVHPTAGTQTELPPRLKKAIALMENNIEEPLSADMIAELVHVSRRQLERLFKRYLDTMPARYYLQLRLKKARQLLQTTNQSVVQIGLMCGFSSGPHFSSAYKSYFELTPREERAKRFYSKGENL